MTSIIGAILTGFFTLWFGGLVSAFVANVIKNPAETFVVILVLVALYGIGSLAIRVLGVIL